MPLAGTIGGPFLPGNLVESTRDRQGATGVPRILFILDSQPVLFPDLAPNVALQKPRSLATCARRESFCWHPLSSIDRFGWCPCWVVRQCTVGPADCGPRQISPKEPPQPFSQPNRRRIRATNPGDESRRRGLLAVQAAAPIIHDSAAFRGRHRGRVEALPCYAGSGTSLTWWPPWRGSCVCPCRGRPASPPPSSRLSPGRSKIPNFPLQRREVPGGFIATT
jgi:hypothetical protein